MSCGVCSGAAKSVSVLVWRGKVRCRFGVAQQHRAWFRSGTVPRRAVLVKPCWVQMCISVGMVTSCVALLGMGAVKLGVVLSRNSYVSSRWYRYGVGAWGRVMLRLCSVMPGVGVATFSGVRVLYRKMLSWYCIACQSSVLVERCRVCAVLAQQSTGSYSAGNATSGRVMPGFCVGPYHKV